MKTKEAIKWLEGFIDSADKGYSISFGYRDILDFRSIVNLLKHGDNYEKMWEELYETYGEEKLKMNFSEKLNFIMESFKQKYFPKPKEIDWKDRFDELEEEFEERERELIQEIEYWKFRNYSGREHKI